MTHSRSNFQCFLCGRLVGQESWNKEHVLGNKFLERYNLKEEKFNSCMPYPTTYSRAKITAHVTCNGSFGSFFENKLLRTFDCLDFEAGDLPDIDQYSYNHILTHKTDTIAQWMTKIMFGLIFWEAEKDNTKGSYRRQLRSALQNPLLKFSRRRMIGKKSFVVPSSVYHFEVPYDKNVDKFWFATEPSIFGVAVKVEKHLFVGLIADGFLTQSYIGIEQELKLQKFIFDSFNKHPQIFIDIAAHIWAVRMNLPSDPVIMYKNNCVINASKSYSIHTRPRIDHYKIDQKTIIIREKFKSEVEN